MPFVLHLLIKIHAVCFNFHFASKCSDDLHRQSHRHDVMLFTCNLAACASAAQWRRGLIVSAMSMTAWPGGLALGILQSLAVTACVQPLGKPIQGIRHSLNSKPQKIYQIDFCLLFDAVKDLKHFCFLFLG